MQGVLKEKVGVLKCPCLYSLPICTRIHSMQPVDVPLLVPPNHAQYVEIGVKTGMFV